VASIFDNGRFFVTSPNTKSIYQPPFGDNRLVRMRRDFRYADDDPIQWPQPYQPHNCHHAAIPRPPSQTKQEYVMWKRFEACHLVLEHDGIARLSTSDQVDIDGLVLRVRARVDMYYKKNPSGNKHPLTTMNTLNHFLTRIDRLPMKAHEFLRCISEVQRFYRELVGSLDYLTVFLPRMDGPSQAEVQVANVMGAFVNDPLIAQELVKAGIPVYFIHPESDARRVRVDAVVAPITPLEEGIVFEDTTPKSPVIFQGRASHPRRCDEIKVASRISLHSPDMFAWAHSDPENPPPLESSRATASQARSSFPRPQPCA
jgi:hypothetical protein